MTRGIKLDDKRKDKCGTRGGVGKRKGLRFRCHAVDAMENKLMAKFFKQIFMKKILRGPSFFLFSFLFLCPYIS